MREGELIIEPEELAREICLLSFENYSQLTPQDLKKMVFFLNLFSLSLF